MTATAAAVFTRMIRINCCEMFAIKIMFVQQQKKFTGLILMQN